MKSYILDLPAVEAIQYDGSEEVEQQIRNLIEDEILIMRDIEGNKCIILQLPNNIEYGISKLNLGDYLFRNPLSKNLTIMSKESFEHIAVEV